MKFTLVTVLAFAASALAQNLSGLPNCALSCATSSIGATGCSLSDFKCICTASSFLTGVDACIKTACSPADQEKTLQFAETLCASAGVTIPVPPMTTAAATTSASSASVTEMSTTMSSAMTSSAASTMTVCVPTTPSASSSAMMTSSMVKSNATASATSPIFTGAASNLQAPVFLGLGMALAAAF